MEGQEIEKIKDENIDATMHPTSDSNTAVDAIVDKDDDNQEKNDTGASVKSIHDDNKDNTGNIVEGDANNDDDNADDNLEHDGSSNDDNHKDDNNGNDDNTNNESNDNQNDKEGSKEGEEEEKSKVQTDEYGRELSAYEIMRLERIRRNKAYLAQLGLESEKSNVTQSIQKEKEEKKKERLKKNKMMEESVIERREVRARKSKAKEVDYSVDAWTGIFRNNNKQQSKSKDGNQNEEVVKKKKRIEKPKDQMVPRFIYREFEHIKKCKNRAVQNGKRLVRAAELECRIAKRRMDRHDEKMKRKIEREEKKMALHTKRLLQPIVEEIDCRRGEMLRAKRDFDAWVKRSSDVSTEDHDVRLKQVEDAKIKFPLALRRNEHELGLLLRARLMPRMEDDSENIDSLSPSKKRRRKKKADHDDEEEEKKMDNSNMGGNMNTTTSASTQMKDSGKNQSTTPAKDEDAIATFKKSTQSKARNVGGPVTSTFASCLQRKWLERDAPIPADISTSFVPQVGDIVLYYPGAHFAFLKENPDTRCIKSRLKQRRPLWEKAKEEKDLSQQVKNLDGNDEISKKAKALQNTTPWWTSEWIKSVDGNAGKFPIICRVEKVIAEFPYDAESITELRRFNYLKKKAQEGKDCSLKDNDNVMDNTKDNSTDNAKRRPLVRKKPPVGLNVSLRPLSKISPPERSKKKSGSSFFEESKLSLPPLFSVLIFPCDQAPFVVPFYLAFRLSLSVSVGDKVKLLDTGGSKRSNTHGTVCQSRDMKNDNNIILEDFIKIVTMDAKADLSSLNRLDHFVSRCYERDPNCCGTSFPESDLRAVIAAALYQCHKRQVPFMQLQSLQNNNIKNELQTPRDDKAIGMNNLLNWILFSLPRWRGVKLSFIDDEGEDFYSVWDFLPTVESDEDSQESILTEALAPSVLIPSTASNYGGFICTLDSRLRSNIENIINSFVANNEKAAWFMSTVTDKTAPEYSRFVPCSMSFRRILRRLKLHKIKNSKHNNDSENPIENDVFNDANGCYYRSVGAILSDITDIYQNCLIYNNPDSQIVSDALEVTSQLKSIINDAESKYMMKKQEEILQAREAKMVANGEDKESLPNQSKSAYKIVTESFDQNYHGPLSRTFIQKCNGAGSYWFPQCGDKILYNRRLHGKFINGHFSSLSTEQRILPLILPRRRNNKQSDKSTTGDENDIDGSKRHQNWLGTVLFARCCFPRSSNSELQTFDVSSPLVAIGIQFHYKWLSNEIHVVYWRPCQVENLDHICGSCPSCGLDLSHSFITPAWGSSLDEILPPYPISLTNSLSAPKSLPSHTVNKFDKCLASLRQRICRGDDVDLFNASDVTNLIDVPSRFHYIFEDVDDESSANNTTADQLQNSKTKQLLQNAAFLPPWNTIGIEEKLVVTRKNNMSSMGLDGKTKHLYDSLIANPHLCLNTIHERLKSCHYRGIFAVAHDLREAFINSVLYIMKENIKTKQLKIDSCFDIIRRLFESRKEVQSDREISNSVVSKRIVDVPINYAYLLPKEKTILQRLELIRKVYAMALFCLIDPFTADIVLGVEKQQIEAKVMGPSEEQMKLRKTLGKILGSLSYDRCSFRSPLSRNSPLPEVKVTIKPPSEKNDIDSTILNSDMDTEDAAIELAPVNYEKNAPLICALFRGSNNVLKVNITYKSHLKKDKRKQPIYLEPSDYLQNVSLVHALFCFGERKSIRIRVKYAGMDSIHDLHVAKKPKESDRNPQPEFSDIEFRNPITYKPEEYELNEVLIKALFCRPRRQNICARCKIGRNGLFTCRVRRAHSNHDFVWNDFIVSAGGINGILKKLKPVSASQPTATNLSQDYKYSNDERSVHIVEKVNESVDRADGANDEVIEESDVLSPAEQLSQAEDLLQLALKALREAQDDSKLKPCLSEEFLKACGLLDPEDGHYEVCVLCGLGGDVLCCDSCPIVSHAKCVGLETIPTGDWHCKQCLHKKETHSERQKETSTPVESSNECDMEHLEKLIDELRLKRQRDKHDMKRDNDNDDDDDDESVGGKVEKVQAIKIGMKIAKRELFEKIGEVTSLPSKNDPFYEVQYEDGVLEKLEVDDVKEGITLFESLGGNDVFGVNSNSTVRSRRQRKQLVPYGQEAQNMSMEKKRKLSALNSCASPIKRQRGRPRKAENNHRSFETTKKRGRGRPRKVQHDNENNTAAISFSVAKTPSSERKRGRPRKKTKVEKKGPTTVDDLLWTPNPGFVDPSMTYYCTVENDTSATIARKVGLNWNDVANEAENIIRFPSLQDKRVRFRKGTLVRIPKHCSLQRVLELTE